jgi:hypothetical protein
MSAVSECGSDSSGQESPRPLMIVESEVTDFEVESADGLEGIEPKPQKPLNSARRSPIIRKAAIAMNDSRLRKAPLPKAEGEDLFLSVDLFIHVWIRCSCLYRKYP